MFGLGVLLESDFLISLWRSCRRDVNNLRFSVPSEFSRKPKGIEELDRWKACELRQFVLYTGLVCLHGLVSNEVYSNFMLLSVAVYILLCRKFCIRPYGRMYGPEFVSYNVHSTVHLADEVKLHGPLYNISAFPFENYLGKIKKMMRKPGATLQQVVKRMSEKN